MFSGGWTFRFHPGRKRLGDAPYAHFAAPAARRGDPALNPRKARPLRRRSAGPTGVPCPGPLPVDGERGRCLGDPAMARLGVRGSSGWLRRHSGTTAGRDCGRASRLRVPATINRPSRGRLGTGGRRVSGLFGGRHPRPKETRSRGRVFSFWGMILFAVAGRSGKPANSTV
jgi:hypothetical protein